MIDAKLIEDGIAKEGRKCEWNHTITAWWGGMPFNTEVEDDYYRIFIYLPKGFRDSEDCWECKILFLMVLFEWQKRFGGGWK